MLCCRALLLRGARPGMETEEGETAHKAALARNHIDIVHLISTFVNGGDWKSIPVHRNDRRSMMKSGNPMPPVTNTGMSISTSMMGVYR